LVDARRVRVIIVNWNGGDFIGAAIDSVRRQTLPAELIVVDNASTDGSPERLEPMEHVTLVRNGTNSGFGAGANVGARGAASDFLAFLNPDAEAAPHWLERLTEWMTKEGIELAGSYIGAGSRYYFTRGEWIGWRGAALNDTRIDSSSADWINGCAMVISRAAFERLGGFDERFFLYCEDADLSFRARIQGLRIGVLRERLVEHESHGRSTGTLGDQKAKIAFESRGRLIGKHSPLMALPIAVVTQAFVVPLVHYRSLRSTNIAAKAFMRGLVPAIRERVTQHSPYRSGQNGRPQHESP